MIKSMAYQSQSTQQSNLEDLLDRPVKGLFVALWSSLATYYTTNNDPNLLFNRSPLLIGGCILMAAVNIEDIAGHPIAHLISRKIQGEGLTSLGIYQPQNSAVSPCL